MKVGTPPQGVNYPIWAWHTREGKRKMPDLRQSGFGEKGTELVRMEIEIPEDQVVLSDFDLWSAMMYFVNLNIRSDEEDEEFRKRMYAACGCDWAFDLFWTRDEKKVEGLSEAAIQIKSEIIESWDRCFDVDAPYNELYGYPGKTIQATFWELRIEQVRKVWRFRCK